MTFATMRPVRLTLLATIVLSGCYTAPPLGAPKTPVSVLQHVFAGDLSTSGFADRTRGAETTLRALAAEPLRTARIAPTAGRILADEPGRLAEIAPRTKSIAADELARIPSAAHVATVLFPSPPARPAEDIRRVARRLLGTEAFLGEIDDVRHRTDPDDDHPEKSLWQRLRRRLWL